MVESTQEVPGWYGKLPGLGDFASRRLPDEFIRPWDAWLQSVISVCRANLGEAWRDCYFTMPIWRFVLLPGVVEPSGWAGVLMPSVDRVGRQFPLTLAVALPSEADRAHAVFESAEWFADMEDAALGVLDPSRGPDDLDRALANCGFTPPIAWERDEADGFLRRLPSADAFGQVAQAEGLSAWSAQAGWKALWWTRGRIDGDPLMLTSAALPTPEEFGWLLAASVTAPPRVLDLEPPISDREPLEGQPVERPVSDLDL